MGPNNGDLVQDAGHLEPDVVDLIEELFRRLKLDTGQIAFEAVCLNGSYLRGFFKGGPLNAQATRELAAG